MKSEDILSERVIFGGLVIVGYFVMIGVGAFALPANSPALALIRDAILPLATLLGVILNAVFKTDKADRQTAAAAATLAAKAPDHSTFAVVQRTDESDETIQGATIRANPLAKKPT